MVDLAAWLLEHGADVHAQNWSRLTPIDMLGRWPVSHPHDGVLEIAELIGSARHEQMDHPIISGSIFMVTCVCQRRIVT
jgi:hypothetical protein